LQVYLQTRIKKWIFFSF